METITGKCHCGDNAYSITSKPEFEFICYCSNCQVLNGGGHLCGLLFDDKNFTASDNTSIYSYDGGSGNPIELHFCPKCATHLYAYPTEYPGKVVIRVNTMKNFNFNPQHYMFKESAFEWDN